MPLSSPHEFSGLGRATRIAKAFDAAITTISHCIPIITESSFGTSSSRRRYERSDNSEINKQPFDAAPVYRFRPARSIARAASAAICAWLARNEFASAAVTLIITLIGR
jgi:hypothetical protein